MKSRKRKALTTKEVVELASELRKKLTELGVNFKPDKPLDGVPVHLADIYEVSVAYQCLVDELLELPAFRKKQAIHLVEQMDQQLCIHLPYHLKHLSKVLGDLTEHLEREGHDRSRQK